MHRTLLLALVLAAACGGSSNANQYAATMTAANEVPPNTSPATGSATFTVNGTTVNYTISYSNLTGPPTVSHIHVGSASVAGGVVVPFTGLPTTATGTWSGSFTAADVKAGTSGSTTIAAGSLDDVIAAMKSGNAYANVHTTANGGGEIRGQINPK